MIGATLGGKYRLTGVLGRGGMGAVYLAEHGEARETVAVKVLHSHLVAPGSAGSRRFQREAEAAGAVRSEHIVRVLDAGTCDVTGVLYLVTEHLEGEDLQRLMDRVGPLSVDAALRIASQALEGLSAAHDANVIHRDIKPANIFLAKGEGGVLCVKLLDFGIAKVLANPLDATDLTSTGTFLGSPLYMSPEQVQNSRDVDARSDLWSLACVLYAALAGRAPHQHLGTVGQVLLATCTSSAPPLSDVAPWVSPEIAGAVHRALQIQRDARYVSASAMREAIERLVQPETLTEDMVVSSGGTPVTPSAPHPSHELTSTPGLTSTSKTGEPSGEAKRLRAVDPHAPTTLRSGPAAEPPAVARSGVPAVGTKGRGRNITVDARRLLGPQTELWTFSLDVHRNLSTLLARIWKSLRRAGAKLAPMTYGKEWVLFEPRTGRIIAADHEGEEPLSLEAAGIGPGVVWVMRPDEAEAEKAKR